MTARWILITCLLAMVPVAYAAAQQDTSKLLSDTRWSEQAYGVSLLPPVDCKLIQQTGDDYLLRIVNAQVPYQITVAVKRSRSAQELDRVVQLSKVQMLNAHGSAQVFQDKVKMAGLDAVRLYYRVDPKADQSALIGQTIAQVNPFTYCVVAVEGPIEKQETLRKVYEAVCDTVQVADQKAMAKARQEAITRSDKWMQSLTEKQITAVLNTEQYFRIVENNKDTGRMHVSSAPAKFNNIDGYRVTVETMIRLPTGRVDSKAEYFTPFDTPIGEAWSVTTTFRPTNATQPARTSREIGTGTSARIEIRIDGTEGVQSKNFDFPRPPLGYMPQAQQWLLPQLLPHQVAAEFGFYAYNSSAEQLSYRCDRLTPTLAGFQLDTRLSPNAPELKAVCNARGQIVEKELGGDRKLIGSSLRELQPLWQLR